VIPGIFSITRIHNTGIAFGLFPGLPDVFMVVTLISMLVVLFFYLTATPRGALLTAGCGLILGGAVGNLIDRFRLHYVIDFIDFNFWPAFNIADSAVTIGVALLMLSFFRAEKGTLGDASDTD
jgi:signal peptidase II